MHVGMNEVEVGVGRCGSEREPAQNPAKVKT